MLTISLDRVPPTVTCRPSPVFQAQDHSIGLLSADVSDALSGSGNEATVGHRHLQRRPEDGGNHRFDDFAGNSTTVTCPYIVVDNRADVTPPIVTVPGDMTVDATGPGGKQRHLHCLGV